MVLSPQDIHNKEFSVKMRGYNIDQVNDFLDQIVKDYQITLQDNKRLDKSLKESQSKVKYFNNLKDSLNQSILVAQEAADKIKANSKKQSQESHDKSKKQADLVLRKAKKQANQIVQDSIHKANELTVEVGDLRRSTGAFRNKIQAMLESQLEFIKSKDWNNLLSRNHHANYGKLTQNIENLNPAHPSSNGEKTYSGNRNYDKGISNKKDNVIIYPDGTYKRI